MSQLEIYKIQRRQYHTEGDFSKVLVYAKGHKNATEIELTSELDSALGPMQKAFFYCTFRDRQFILGPEAPWQEW